MLMALYHAGKSKGDIAHLLDMQPKSVERWISIIEQGKQQLGKPGAIDQQFVGRKMNNDEETCKCFGGLVASEQYIL